MGLHISAAENSQSLLQSSQSKHQEAAVDSDYEVKAAVDLHCEVKAVCSLFEGCNCAESACLSKH